ncbi:ABC-type antimicrobial peptide transport system, ATPase component [Anaerolinea thermolimosa]|uniref:ABC transporter ATP-binding protein n=1 Tax=Anaerolinea thermolimosa TaxID=229919 RepID=UPI000A01ED0B|nr:ABC transporter ATP-binding protein [Anaerolinea thermolimosa]GAP06888.1 ABC-type antimicrobial peptide transport system, ATPase component [Anaerolinea thermolimosa]
MSDQESSETKLTAVAESAVTTPPTVEVKNVKRIYEVGASRVMALRGVTLSVPNGVLAALKGRSGSGKTTLLNIIGGLDKPTEGEVFLFGHKISEMANEELIELRRKKIGFVFQSFAIMPMFSAVENVELMLRIAGYTENRRQLAMRALEIVGLGPWAHHRPWELSGGQQQRVAIARALSTHPELIIADEPTGELDSSTGRQIMALFRYIAVKEGITILMATHDPMVEEYAHIVFELGDGQIKEVRMPNP